MREFSLLDPVEKTENGYRYNWLAKNHPVKKQKHQHFGDVLVYEGKNFLSYYRPDGEHIMLYAYSETEGYVNAEKKVHKEHLLHFISGEFVTNNVTCNKDGKEEVRTLEFIGLENKEYIYSICVNKKWQIVEQSENADELHEKLADFAEDLHLSDS